jgi:hypothetical protein
MTQRRLFQPDTGTLSQNLSGALIEKKRFGIDPVNGDSL